MSRGIGAIETTRSALPDAAITAFETITHLGDVAAFFAALALFYWLSPERRGTGASLIGLAFAGYALTIGLKAAIGWPRPPAELQLAVESGYGFPSGHAVGATIVWGGLALWSDLGPRRVRWAAAGTLIGLVSLSRVVLGVHYLVDVLAGVVLGVAFLAAVARFLGIDPIRTFGLAAILGALALVATGGADGLLALAGGFGGVLAWRLTGSRVDGLRVGPISASLALAALGIAFVGTYASGASQPVLFVVSFGVPAAVLGLPLVSGSEGSMQ